MKVNVGLVFAAIGASYVIMEAYNAGRRDVHNELVTSEVPSAEADETDSSSKSQPDDGE
jgi:hypothetical protein